MNNDFDRLRQPDSGDADGGDPNWLNDVFGPAGDEIPASGPDPKNPNSDDPLAWLRDYEPDELAASTAPEPAGVNKAPAPSLDWLQQYAAPVEPPTPQDEDELPEWIKGELASAEPSVPQVESRDAGTPIAEDDWFGGLDEALGLAPSLTPATAQTPAENDVSDWFAEPQVLAQTDSPEWLEQIGPITASEPSAETAAGAAPVMLDDDLFPELEEVQPEPSRTSRAAEFPDFDTFDSPGLQDIDALLARYESTQPKLPDTSERLLDPNPDIDRLLSDEGLERIGPLPGETARELPPMAPDAPAWLAEISSTVGSVGEESAAAIVRKNVQTERPLEQLTDRLRALHEAGLELPAEQETQPGDALKSLLPGISELIPLAPIKPGIPGIAGELILSPEQGERARILRTLVALDEERPSRLPSAIDLTLASSNLSDFAEPEFGEAPSAAATRTTRRTRQRVRIPVIRLLVSTLVALSVILPFVYGPLRIGELPPANFMAGSRQQSVFDRLNALTLDQYVLIAAEYGTGGAAELDASLDAIARHVLARGAHPVLVSGNPIGLLHARNVLGEISADAAFAAAVSRTDQPLQVNQDYFVTRFLIGEIVGLRALGQDLLALIQTDISGANTSLPISSLNDFAAIVIISEQGEDIRGWVEQVAPITSAPLLAVASYSAAPLAEPYVLPGSPAGSIGMRGLLVGFSDAYTYRAMLNDALVSGAFQSIARPVHILLPEATSEVLPPEATTTPEPQAIVATLAVVTPAPTEPLPATTEPAGTPLASPTIEPTTAEPVDNPLTGPAPAEITAEPAQPSIPVIQAVIAADQAINVRSGPARTFAPIDVLEPGTTVEVIGRDATGEWIQIRLADGREGWVSTALLRIQEPVSSTPTPGGGARTRPTGEQWVGLMSDTQSVMRAQTEATPESTPDLAIDAQAVGGNPITTSTLAFQEERWYGMTLGLMVIILLVALGAVMNILRGLLRRGDV